MYDLLRDHRELCGNYDFTTIGTKTIRDDGEVIHEGEIVEGDDTWCGLVIDCIERNEHMIRMYDTDEPRDVRALVELEFLDEYKVSVLGEVSQFNFIGSDAIEYKCIGNMKGLPSLEYFLESLGCKLIQHLLEVKKQAINNDMTNNQILAFLTDGEALSKLSFKVTQDDVEFAHDYFNMLEESNND